MRSAIRSTLKSTLTRRHSDGKNCKQFVRSLITKETIAAVLLYVCMFTVIIVLISLGLVDVISDYVLGIGIAGNAIFFGLIIVVTQPFGFGYTPLIVAVGYVYSWPGLALAQISTIVGSLICFLECRYLARESLQKRVEKLQPRLHLFVLKLDEIATQKVKSSYPIMILSRNSPLNIGMVNGIFALSECTVTRFIITTVIGTLLEQPISINIGILIRKVTDIEAAALESNSTQALENSTNTDLESLEREQQFLRTVVFSVSVTVTVLFLSASILYTKWMMKNLLSVSAESIEQQLKEMSSKNLSVAMRSHSDDENEDKDGDSIY